MKKYIIKFIGSYLNILSFISADYAARKALDIFATPRKGRLNAKHIATLKSAKKIKLKHEEHNIMTYHWQGQKATVLLVHGWESNTARWHNNIEHLTKQDYNIIALDAPAHGASDGNFFNALLYAEFINVVAQKHQPDIIIGHSVGGMASIFFQQKYQIDSIKKMVLLGAPSEFSGVLKNYTRLLGYNRKIEQQLDKIIIERFGAAPNDFSASKYAQDIEAQSLIIHDTEDNIIPYSDAKLLNQGFKNSKIITTKGFGHSLNNDSVSNYILEFIKV
ncbi:MAG: alpha/beta fold hydrolase [Flavobacteriaceae bacterium]|nr:alpha/beta fold hydrolase [Flavobacteriaceae bacterium]